MVTLNYLVVLLVCFFVIPSEAQQERFNETRLTEALDYLVGFGYLSRKWTQSTPLDRILQLEPFKVAVTKFQTLAKVNLTGQVDDATFEAMSWSRCGVSDANLRNTSSATNFPGQQSAHPSANYVLFATKWATKNLTYKVTRYTVDISQQDTDELFAKLFGQWAAATQLSIQPVESDPLLEIKWATGYHGDDQPFTGPGGVLGHTFFPPLRLSEGRNLPGDTHFNDDNTWSLEKGYGRISLPHVALHEFGHGLGLDHSVDVDAVMYPFFTQATTDREVALSPDDIEGIQQIYGKPTSGDFETRTSLTATSTIANRRSLARGLTPARVKLDDDLCPYNQSRPITAIFNLFRVNTTFANIGGKIYRFIEGSGIYPGYPKETFQVFPDGPNGTVSSILTLKQYAQRVYIFQGDIYWHFEARFDRINANQPTDADGLHFVKVPSYPRRIAVGFKSICSQGECSENGPIVFQLPGQFDTIYFLLATNSLHQLSLRGNVTSSSPLTHPILRSLPVRRPRLQAAMLFNGKSYFFASNGSYWVWRDNSTDTSKSLSDGNALPAESDLEARLGTWFGPVSTAEWWFGCEDVVQDYF